MVTIPIAMDMKKRTLEAFFAPKVKRTKIEDAEDQSKDSSTDANKDHVSIFSIQTFKFVLIEIPMITVTSFLFRL
jgi:hypothetical protein